MNITFSLVVYVIFTSCECNFSLSQRLRLGPGIVANIQCQFRSRDSFQSLKLTAHTGPKGPAGRWSDVAFYRLRGRNAQGAAADRRGPGGFRDHRPRHLARRVKCRQAQLDQQSLSRTRVRHHRVFDPLRRSHRALSL